MTTPTPPLPHSATPPVAPATDEYGLPPLGCFDGSLATVSKIEIPSHGIHHERMNALAIREGMSVRWVPPRRSDSMFCSYVFCLPSEAGQMILDRDGNQILRTS